MTLSEYIYKHLSGIAKTVPVVAPIETDLPLITYLLDGQESTRTLNSGGYLQNFVTITAYETEYDKANTLAQNIKDVLNCDLEAEQDIIGVTYTSATNGYENEPVKRYFVTLEFNIFERV